MTIRHVFSAGGIVLRPIRNTQGQRDKLSKKPKLEVLVTQHSGHKGWDFPKGHIEVGESAQEATIREVEEETGVVAEIIEKVGESEYFYFERGERVFKTVTFFLMKYLSEGKATTAFEVSDLVWLPVGEVENRLSFRGSKEVWRKAKVKIK